MKNSRVLALLLAISLITTSLPAAFAVGEAEGQSTASSGPEPPSAAAQLLAQEGAPSFLHLLGTLFWPGPLLALARQPSEAEGAQPAEPAAPPCPTAGSSTPPTSARCPRCTPR